MRKTIAIFILWILSAAVYAKSSNLDSDYLPELSSPAWSPELTKAEIAEARMSIYRMRKYNDIQARKVLAPYAKDPRNIEIRNAYALALARVNIEKAISELKLLSIEGYPPSMLAYREERLCQLDKYREACTKYGFDWVMKEAYLSWVRKDPIDPKMYFYAYYWHLPNTGRKSEDSSELTDEALSILHEGIENGCSSCAKELAYHYLSFAESEDDIEAISKTKPYMEKTKEMMISGLGRAETDNICFQSFINYCVSKKNNMTEGECLNRQKEEYQYGICLSEHQNLMLLDELAKKGDLVGYQNLFVNISPNDFNKNSAIPDSLYDYIWIGDEDRSLSPRIKKYYDRAIELNNGRGWRAYNLTENIEKWERLLEDKDSRDFFEKVGELLDAQKD
ncbi:hypothetical protein [Vibrio fluminensis]|uniref:hypothetical protein n=1 Tax=Vibrio fluminensis TaxID=2783614 RepID=UPI001888B444|nr:hypothetical protein [Vibrio fluminensis]